MAEYYKPESTKRTSDISSKEAPYKKIFARQLIIALICFLLLKFFTLNSFSFSDNFREKIKNYITYNTDLSFINTLSEKVNNIFPVFNIIETNEAEQIEKRNSKN